MSYVYSIEAYINFFLVLDLLYRTYFVKYRNNYIRDKSLLINYYTENFYSISNYIKISFIL